MTEEQKNLFYKLANKRKKFAELSQDADYKGIWEVLIKGIYSEDAHFIYELLQNAEDAKATSVKFILKEKGLYFIHNGTVLFSVTDIDNLEENGHINAITALGRTGKNIAETIGKFGIGFKAIFQYTKSPYIYDPNFKFKIYNYIVPELLENPNNDVSYDEKIETLFYFPFLTEKEETDNSKVKNRKDAYKDIQVKLKYLNKPTLFLFNLKEIIWEIEGDSNKYKKDILELSQNDNILVEKVVLRPEDTEYFIFNRSEKESISGFNLDYSYSVGFKIESKKLKPVDNSNAFCFFPTKQKTNLNFLIHAPFILNSNRESIPERQDLKIKNNDGVEQIIKENFNEFLIEKLSVLAADSLLILRDLNLINDDIIKIVPYKKPENDDLFAPFYYKIKQKFETEELLPAKYGCYARKHNAYWAQDKPVVDLFSNEQLSLLLKEANAKWVFSNFVRNQTGKDDELKNYIENIINDWYDMGKLLRCIDANFIENQSDEWLHRLYAYLSKNNYYWSEIKTKPIFLDKERKAVPAFEKRGNTYHEILFLPSNNTTISIKTIFPEFLNNENSKEFFNNFGIKQPSLKDEIYNHILPLYDINEGIDTEPHFKMFFRFWKEEGRPDDFLDLIKNKQFIVYKTKNTKTKYRGKASDIYYPDDYLEKYFEAKPDTKFVDLEFYHKLYTNIPDKNLLKDFLSKLGVAELPRILKVEITDPILKEELNLKKSTHGYNDRNETTDIIIDGCKEVIKETTKGKSLLLWHFLGKLQHKVKSTDYWNRRDVYFLNSELIGKHTYFNYARYLQSFESTTLSLLRTKKWLLSNNGKFVAPSKITINELADEYNINYELESLLQFRPVIVLTKEEEKLKYLEDNDIDIEELKEFIDWKKRKKPQESNSINTIKEANEESNTKTSIEKTIKDLDDLQNELVPNKKEKNRIGVESDSKPEIKFDEDEELSKGLETLKNQLEIKKSRVELTNSINLEIKYSYDWFEAYLKLLTTYAEKQNAPAQKSISFQEIKAYKPDNKYFLLCGASSYFTHEIENAEDFKISLVFRNGKKEHIDVEGVSKKGQDLLIYCRQSIPADLLSRLANVFKVEINFTPVIDLLDRLYKAFTNSSYINKWQDITEEIPPLNYIYGPPGTGKTTKLCAKINEEISNNPNAKFLVLTPTNKAADVVCKKLRVINYDIFSVRLSRPTDPELDEAIYCDVLDDNNLKSINVVASTIHRLPYFDIKNIGLLFQYKWDYVIFDESSMTGLHYIIFAIMSLFKSNPDTFFIIAGDPKQIPPILEIDDKELENFDFHEENIYKMMGLESFNPKEQKIRPKDRIENLVTQYRSAPAIGQLFSELSYSSLLKHDRTSNREESKPLPDKFKALITSNVTFIDVPVNRYNSIYKVNKLFYSSYHTYSAILVSEIIKYFDSVNEDKDWTIGIIAPYKAQAVLTNKLITSYGISEKIKVYSDTVHGFQGDECDIVFFVCNPNNYNYTGHQKSLLSKEYIYNVAISRAKDYLVVLHPFSIDDNPFVNQIGISYRNNFGNKKILEATAIEAILFNNKKYIEHNSYVSGHDNVNVFGLSEMKYFIKSNDTAIDIQLRDLREEKTFEHSPEKNIKTKDPKTPEVFEEKTNLILGLTDKVPEFKTPLQLDNHDTAFDPEEKTKPDVKPEVNEPPKNVKVVVSTSTVKVKYIKTGYETKVKLIKKDLHLAVKKKGIQNIGCKSPLARSILGRHEGEIVKLENLDNEVEILKIYD